MPVQEHKANSRRGTHDQCLYKNLQEMPIQELIASSHTGAQPIPIQKPTSNANRVAPINA